MNTIRKIVKGIAFGILMTGGIIVGSIATYLIFKDRIDWIIIKISTNNTIERIAIWGIREMNGDWLEICLKKFVC